MKKKISVFNPLLIPAILIIIGTTSCKKNNNASNPIDATTEILEKTFSISSNGVLRISSAGDYRKIVEEFDSRQKQQVIGYLDKLGNFKSYKEARKSADLSGPGIAGRTTEDCSPLPDSVLEEVPLISSMLNEEGVLQIGANLYKASWNLNAVFVMDSSNISAHYEDLISCTEIPGVIGVFPMDVDVVDYVEDGQRTYPGDDYETDPDGRLFCFRRGAQAHWGSDQKGYDDWVECDLRYMKIKVEYLKLGFYFHLYTVWKGQVEFGGAYWTMGSGNGTREWYGIYNYTYKVKCGGSGSGSGTVPAPLSGEDKAGKTAYESSRGLSSYSMCSDFAIKCKYLLKWPPDNFCKTVPPPTSYLLYSAVSGHQNCISSN